MKSNGGCIHDLWYYQFETVGISELHFIFKRIWKYERSLADCKKQGTCTNCSTNALYLEYKFIVLGLDAQKSWMHDYDFHEALYLNCEIQYRMGRAKDP